ncbi:hypothetical protein EXN66_Car014230 [Channa argus]|uniref:Uncharacterized protein n=1 Tax=Channa argus TaxID=215402 RepID=A0A6G1Q806_CHAAH|nr:hypothetical protein EXN66_Car014230 [Channa argus]
MFLLMVLRSGSATTPPATVLGRVDAATSVQPPGRVDAALALPVPVALLRAATARLVPVPLLFPAQRSTSVSSVSVFPVSMCLGPAPDSDPTWAPAFRPVSASPGPDADVATAPASRSLDASSGLDTSPATAPASGSLAASPSLNSGPGCVPVPGVGSAAVWPGSVPVPDPGAGPAWL